MAKTLELTNKGETVGYCPECNSNVIEGTKSFYCSSYQEGCRFNLWKTMLLNFGLPCIPKEWATELLSGAELQMHGLKISKTGKPIAPYGKLQKKNNGKYWIAFANK